MSVASSAAVFVRPRRESGLTLIEVMISLAVVLVGLAGVTAMMIGTQHANNDVLNYQRALSYTEELMEELMTVSYANLDAQASVVWDVAPNPATSPDTRQTDPTFPFNPTQITFRRTVTVTPIASQNLKRVTVTTTWSDALGTATRSHTVTLETLRSPDPL